MIMAIVLSLALMFGVGTANAEWRIKNNPDQVPSVGVVLDTLKGRDHATVDKATFNRSVVDLRLPVTPFMTIEAGYIHDVNKIQTAQFGTLSDIHSDGYRVGVRFYLAN